MDTLGPSPFVWLPFDQDGGIPPAAVADLSALVDSGIDDLLVISHGWNNDKGDALHLYTTLWGNTVPHLPAGRAARIGVAGVQWPAKAYRTDFDASTLAGAASGGSLSVGGASQQSDLPNPQFDQTLADFAALGLPGGAQAIAAARQAAGAGLSAAHSLALVRSGTDAVGLTGQSPDRELALDARGIVPGRTDPVTAQMMMATLALPPHLRVDKGTGAAQGLGDVLTGVFSGPQAAAARFLNMLTYYEMKKRAGAIGAALADTVLSPLRPAAALRLHLVGHSFGARLVTAAAERLVPGDRLGFATLTLLQGAFSHNALAAVVAPNVAGAFPNVVQKPDGPITITHTHNDLACTLAYAVASRLSRDIATSIGDADDDYGAMGANGPQKLAPGLVELDDTTAAFRPRRGKVNPILADAFVVATSGTDAHNNVTNPEAGRLLAAILAA